MQSTVPEGNAPDRQPGSPPRKYVVVVLALVLLVAAFAVVLLVRSRPSGPGPGKPLPDTAEPTSNYQLNRTLAGAFGPQSWSPDGRYLVTYSTSTRGIQVHDLGGPNPRTWSVPAEASYNDEGIGIADKAIWSPDSRLLAVDNAGSSVPYTVTLVDAERGALRNTIHVPGPLELAPTPTPAGRDRSEPVRTFHQLVGWADNGRSLVTLVFVQIPEDVDPGPGHSLFEPIPTSQPALAPSSPSFSVYFYIHDAATGDMVSSTQVYTTTSYPGLYGLALSPDGNTLAFATTSRTTPSAEIASQVSLDLWDLRAGTLKHRVQDLGGQAIVPYPGIWDQFLAWSPDGATLYLASDNTVKAIEVATGKIVRCLPEIVPPTSTPRPAAPRLTPGAPHTPVPDPDMYYPIQSIELSPSGDRLAVADYRTIRVWDTAGGNLRMLTSLPGTVPSSLNASMYMHSHARLTWLAGGRLLASYFSDYQTGIWLIDPKTGVHLRQLAEGPQYVAWSPATNMLATGTQEQGVEIWTPNDGQGPVASPTSNSIP